MQFSIIYSVDCPEDIDIDDYAPPQVEELWDETEDDSCYEYSYLEGRWENGSHRKWCAILDREQFDEFVERCGLFAEDVATMGSLGAPGFGFGWAPAISFNGDDPDAIQSAYITPIPETKREQLGEREWLFTAETTIRRAGVVKDDSHPPFLVFSWLGQAPATSATDTTTRTTGDHMVAERKPLFPLGQIVATPGALEQLAKAQIAPSDLLDRHVHGDFGELCEEDVEANEQALKDGNRLLSSYRLSTGQKVWVLTEAADDHGQRAATTLLLPEEY